MEGLLPMLFTKGKDFREFVSCQAKIAIHGTLLKEYWKRQRQPLLC